MNKVKLLFQLLFLTSFWCSAIALDKAQELQRCLEERWGVDPHTSRYIIKKCDPLLEKKEHHFVIDDFIEKSQQLTIDFSSSKELQTLPEEDGVLCAPKHHLVVFENPYIRILWGSALPGEREPLHSHQWKSLMLVIKPTTFEIENFNGPVEIWNGSIGVYELPANEHYACTNIGSEPDECFRFEIKESSHE